MIHVCSKTPWDIKAGRAIHRRTLATPEGRMERGWDKMPASEVNNTVLHDGVFEENNQCVTVAGLGGGRRRNESYFTKNRPKEVELPLQRFVGTFSSPTLTGVPWKGCSFGRTHQARS